MAVAVTWAPEDPSFGWLANGFVMSMITLPLSDSANFRAIAATEAYGSVMTTISPASIAA